MTLPMAASAQGRSSESGDGRVRRGERSREAIVAALFQLIGEGVPRPTAQQVAERARVNIRTVFRHFSEMESLYAALDARLRGDLQGVLEGGPPRAGVEERAAALVRQHCAVFEKIAPYKRSSNSKRWGSKFLTEAHRELVRELRRRLLLWLPELEDISAETRNAIELLTSFEAWDRLRSDQRLGRSAARATIERAVVAVLATR
jgi:AcrR family transcriptional regulator